MPIYEIKTKQVRIVVYKISTENIDKAIELADNDNLEGYKIKDEFCSSSLMSFKKIGEDGKEIIKPKTQEEMEELKKIHYYLSNH